MADNPIDRQKGAFVEALYNDYKVMMLRTAYKYLEGDPICEDIVHEAFLRVIRNAEKLYAFDPRQLSSYLYLVVRNLCFDYLRMHNKITPLDNTDETFLELLAKKRAQRSGEIGTIQKAELKMAIGQVTGEDQALLIGYYCRGLTSEDLAQTFGGTDSGIRTKIHRAKKRLLEAWKQSGLNMGDFYR